MPTVRATAADIAEWERRGLIPAIAPTEPVVTAHADVKPSKFGNRRTEVDGLAFASKREARRYLDLREQQRAGRISDLRTQVEFPIAVNGVAICVYIADFVFLRDGVQVVEDAKGCRTDVYKLKRRLMEAFGIDVVEV